MAVDRMLKGKGRFADCLMQKCQRHAPWFADSSVAAGQAHLAKMTGPPETVISADQELAAPNRAVTAVTGTVKNQADNLTLQPILGHACGQVGMMVLHRNER